MVSAVDSIQEQLADYGSAIRFADLPDEVVHVAKVRLIDTLGVLLGGFAGEPCRIARELAAQMPNAAGATILGTRMTVAPEMAAFANGTTARYLEYTDVYHYPGSMHGHPSDVIMPVLAAAEHARVNAREFITGIVLAYDVYGYVSDAFRNEFFDNANFCCIAAAVGAGRMLGLTKRELAHCISMAVVPNIVLRQVRKAPFGVWKEVAAGHAARAAVFSAQMARAGMAGPPQPFEGAAGWCEHVVGGRLALDGLGTDYKILHTRTRHRPAMGETHASIFAAEKIGQLARPNEVKRVTVEVYKRAKDLVGTNEMFWTPETRETADHSLPYVVAAALFDGAVTRHSFADDRLWNADLRGLLQKIEVVESAEFTAAYARVPREQRARVTVITQSGERLVGEAGGDKNDLAAEKSDDQISEKFRSLTEDLLGAKQVTALLDRLWSVEAVEDVSVIPKWLVGGSP